MKPLELFFFSTMCYSSVYFAWLTVVHFKVYIQSLFYAQFKALPFLYEWLKSVVKNSLRDKELVNVNIWNIYFELRMKDQIEERSSQLLRNLSSCEKLEIFFRLSFRNWLSCVVTARIFLLFEQRISLGKSSFHRLIVCELVSLRFVMQCLFINVSRLSCSFQSYSIKTQRCFNLNILSKPS